MQKKTLFLIACAWLLSTGMIAAPHLTVENPQGKVISSVKGTTGLMRTAKSPQNLATIGEVDSNPCIYYRNNRSCTETDIEGIQSTLEELCAESPNAGCAQVPIVGEKYCNLVCPQ